MALTRIQPARQEEYTLYGVCHYNRVLTNQPRRCVLGRGRRVVCSSNLAIVWTVSLSDDDDSLVLFRGSSHTNESLGGGGKKKEKSELPLGRNVWLLSPAAGVLSALYESPISENFMMLLEKKQKQKKAQQICSHVEQLKFPQNERMMIGYRLIKVYTRGRCSEEQAT